MNGNSLASPQLNKGGRVVIAGTPFDLISEEEVFALVKERRSDMGFEYIATPNVDHVVRTQKIGCRDLYDDAMLSLCDSRVLAGLSVLLGVRFPSVIPGSDLTYRLFTEVLKPGDEVTVIGCDDLNMSLLRQKYPKLKINHHNPPMGFIHDERAVKTAVDFILSHPSRYVFLAIGSPQQELLARAANRAGATGLGFCIGASILFLTGGERRAPKWVQKIGFEWTYRLLNNPRRLWKRYLIQNPVIFFLVFRQMLSRQGNQ